MGKVSLVLTVYFEEPFWVGVFECTYLGKTSATRVTFGAEPKDNEVYEFFLKHFTELRFSPAVAAAVSKTVSNPKRMQREAKKQTSARGIGTKSQQALKLWQEQNKLERKTLSREQKEAEKARKFELKQQKKSEKHRGH
ncbi:MAG: YjdF family protein [Saccharofermentans sp.]|nr:YjdF family protein [Saccharofermentans sp.]